MTCEIVRVTCEIVRVTCEDVRLYGNGGPAIVMGPHPVSPQPKPLEIASGLNFL